MTTPKNFMNGKLLTLKEVLARLRISKSTWYAGVSRKEFPQPVRIGLRSVFWLESDIEDYLQKRYLGPVRATA